MHEDDEGGPRSLDADTTRLLFRQIADAEHGTNGVRIAVLGVLSIAAAIYAPHLPGALSSVNLTVLAPMLAWAIGQHVLWHRTRRASDGLFLANIILDISATTLLLLGYGMFGDPNLAVKSPIFTMYFIVLAIRPFTGSTRRAAFAGVLAATQYAALVTFLVRSGRLAILVDPMRSAASSGTTLLDEGAKVVMLLVAGAVSTYATAWIQRTLERGISARRNADARFRAVFEQSGVGVALLGESARIVEVNGALAEFLGTSVEALTGEQLHGFSPSEDAEVVTSMEAEVSNGARETASAEVRYLRTNGDVAWGSLTLSRAAGTHSARLIAVVQDVTQRKSLESELLRQAFYDQLTGLANRSLFRDRVVHALSRAERERELLAVMFLDLDNFKSINDTMGHAAGDELLSIVGTRLLNATRGCDTVARLGGDEFAVLLEHVRGDADATIVADRITQALSHAVELSSGATVRVSASIGIARVAEDDGVDELLRNADVAMYAAKGAIRGGYVFFDASMHAALVDRVSMESNLRDALDAGEFWVAYQPIVALESHEVLGIEALLRWNHPVKGSIAPAEFIELAEETGLIIPIGRWVMREACTRTAEWNAKRGDGRSFSVTVNLSVRQLESPSLVTDVLEALQSSGLAPTLLVLEITENALMHRTEATLERLHDLKALGVRLAIDDFGTGYSSLSYLQQFPVDILKIDRAFTDGLMRGTHDDALARTIIALGDLLTLRTIAEGVEHARQHSRLRDLGCDYGQGYLFSRPLAPADMDRLLTSGYLELPGESPIVLRAEGTVAVPEPAGTPPVTGAGDAPELGRGALGRDRSGLKSLSSVAAIPPLGVADPRRRSVASASGAKKDVLQLRPVPSLPLLAVDARAKHGAAPSAKALEGDGKAGDGGEVETGGDDLRSADATRR
ncbi:MAG: EAL domain-containing protein [Gemmatimonadota bacterium]